MKIAVIGGASSYTPELVDGLFSRLSAIPVLHLWLMDPNHDRLTITSSLARRMSERHGSPFSVHATGDMREAVEGARYVVTQIRVGGARARIADEKLGLSHNLVGQETTGVGGFACSLRTIPRVLEVARAMEELSPGGILINFTNPAGIITEAVLKHSTIPTVGLCNIPIGFVMDVVERTGCGISDVRLDYVGLNHLSWIRGFEAAGRDVTDQMLEHYHGTARDEWPVDGVWQAMQLAMESLGAVCNPYLQYFYATDTMIAHLKARPGTRGEDVIEIERALFEKYAREDLAEKPEELSKRGGAHYSTAAFQLIESIETDANTTQVVCCRNDGAIPTFDDDVAVEAPAIIGRDGARPLAQDAPTPAVRGLMQAVKAYESLTVEAAVTGDRNIAFQAMLEHPLMPGATGSRALLDELLQINKPFLTDTFFKERSGQHVASRVM